jgi:hypothetical protein
MATLTGKKIKNTYDALLKLSDNDNLTTTAKQVTDGFGNNAPLYISTTQIGIGVTPEVGYDLHVYSDAKVGGNLTITGDLTVNGTTTTVDTDTLRVEDPLIELARLNTSADSVDIGFYGKYHPSGTTLYSGLFRDAGDGKYKLFKDLQTEPTTTVNTSGTGYTKAGLVIGNLETTQIDLGDNEQIRLGSNQELQIYFDSNTDNSFIKENGSNHLMIQSQDLQLLNRDGTEFYIHCIHDGAVELYYDGSKKLETTSTGLSVTGKISDLTDPTANQDAATKKYVDDNSGASTLSEVLSNGNTTGGTHIDVSAGDDINLSDTSEIHLGDDADLVIKHNGTNTTINNNTGQFNIYQLQNDGDIKFFCDDGAGGTENYLQIDGGEQRIKVFNEMRFNDNVELRLGTGNDLRLFHNATNSFIDNYKGDLQIRAHEADKDIVLKTDDGSDGTSNYIVCDGSTGAVRLSHYGTEKFETTSSGVSVTGSGTFSGDVALTGSGDKIISAISSDDDATLFLSGAGSGKDTHIVFGGDRDLFISKSSSATAASEGTPVLTLGSNSNASFAGSVGIGTTSPQSNLHISTSATNSAIRLQNDNGSGSTANYVLQTDSSGLGNNGFGIYDVAQTAYRFVINGSGSVGIGTESPNMKLNIHHADQDGLRFNCADGLETFIDFGDASDNDIGRISYDHADNHMAFRTNNAERMRIDSSGNVGIGQTSPDTILHITKAMSSSPTPNIYLDVSGTNTAGGGGSVIFSSSSTAGTTTNYNAAIKGIRNSLDNGSSDLQFFTTHTADGAAATEKMRIQSDGKIAIGNTSAQAHLHVNSGTTNTVALFESTDTATTIKFKDSTGTCQIETRDDFRFSTSGGEKMRIENGGKVGIGTTSPQRELHVELTSDHCIISAVSGTSRLAGLVLGDTDDDDKGAIIYDNSSDYLYFNSNGAERMRIDSSGNVGIGTTSPSDALEIYGDTKGIIIQNTAETDSGIMIRDSADGGQQASIKYGSGDNDLNFFNGDSTTIRFRIDNTGDAHLARYLRHQGDTNSYLGWNANDDFRILVGGIQMLRYDEGISGTDYTQMMDDEFRLYANGDFHADGDLVAYSTTVSSDKRLKKDIKPIDNALDIVDKLQGVHFNWKENDEKSIGYIAQDVEKVLPEMVTEKNHFDKGEFKTVNYAAMVSIMGEAIKELRAEVEQLKKQIK